MAADSPPARTPEDIQRDIDAERDGLAGAVNDLRSEFDVTQKLRDKLPLATVGALAAGFVLSGGIAATVRLFSRREHD
jgi:Protein of unknown function (DUF3618)